MNSDTIVTPYDSTDNSLVDLIQIDSTPVTTVAESKTKKALRQINLATLVQQLGGFTAEEIANYPIFLINSLADESARIVNVYDIEIEKLRAARNG